MVIGGLTFDSKHEYERWCRLKIMDGCGLIHDLQRQVKFELVPAQYEPDLISKSGKRKRGRIIERPVTYIADFVYKNEDGKIIVEDAKGVKTEAYKIKRKLMLERYGIKVVEV